MTNVAPGTRNQKQAALIGIIGISFVLGVVDLAIGGDPTAMTGRRALLTIVGNAALLLAGFRWLSLDARELDIRRPTWLNVGIVLLALVFVPYYFYKTRPEGRRAAPIAGFFGLAIASMFASGLGVLAMSAISGTPLPQ